MATQATPLTQRIPVDAKSNQLPFSMIEKMMPHFPKMAILGWLIVFAALLIGLFVVAPARATFFSDAKAVREGAAVGSPFVNATVTLNATKAWVPSLKFLGFGLMLMSIVMALGTIAMKLRYMGKVMTSHIPAADRPTMPEIPKAVRVFQITGLLGMLILTATLIAGIVLAAGVVPSYWDNSIIQTLNKATLGSTLLTQEGVVKSYAAWLNPTRMVGMGFLFTSITVALMVIINTLKVQANLLIGYYKKASV